MQYFCYSHLISVVSLQSHPDCLILNRWRAHLQHFNQPETVWLTDAGMGGRVSSGSVLMRLYTEKHDRR